MWSACSEFADPGVALGAVRQAMLPATHWHADGRRRIAGGWPEKRRRDARFDLLRREAGALNCCDVARVVVVEQRASLRAAIVSHDVVHVLDLGLMHRHAAAHGSENRRVVQHRPRNPEVGESLLQRTGP